MAQLDVEPKKNNDWWKWLVGILAAIIIIWVIVEATGTDDVDDMDDMEDMEQMDQTTPENPTTTFIDREIDYTFS